MTRGKSATPATCQLCGRFGSIVIDHDHATGHIRGRLCNTCNAGLGMFRDDADLLARAIAYLRVSRDEPPDLDLPASVLLVDAVEAGRVLGITEGAVRRLIRARAMPIVRIGAEVRIHVRHLRRLAAGFVPAADGNPDGIAV